MVLDLALGAAAAGLGGVIALGVTAESSAQLRAPGGVATFLGNLAGLSGTFLALLMVLLVARLPAVERALGQDSLVRLHRRLAPWPISLLTLHAILLIVGYAAAARTGWWHETDQMVFTYPDVLFATIGLGLMLAVAIVSIRAVRERLPRERWWALHLMMYLALALSFAHVIALGPSFVGHPWTRLVWTLCWLSTAGVVLVYRVGLPFVRSLYHRIHVVKVETIGPGMFSITLRGRRLDRLAVSGGQFFEWRFLAPGLWWQAHPFSISARPRPPYLRITIKAVGDFTARLAAIRPGTRVAIEGPYGAFTAHARKRTRAALIAGGIGVTAIRALLEDLPPAAAPVVVLRATSTKDLALAREVDHLAHDRRGRVHHLVGPRTVIDLRELGELIPDLADRDVFIAGSEPFVRRAVGVARRLGVPAEALHWEAFAL